MMKFKKKSITQNNPKEKKKQLKGKVGGGGELNWVNPPNPWVMSWDMDNPIKKKMKKTMKLFLKKNQCWVMKLKKKINP